MLVTNWWTIKWSNDPFPEPDGNSDYSSFLLQDITILSINLTLYNEGNIKEQFWVIYLQSGVDAKTWCEHNSLTHLSHPLWISSVKILDPWLWFGLLLGLGHSSSFHSERRKTGKTVWLWNGLLNHLVIRTILQFATGIYCSRCYLFLQPLNQSTIPHWFPTCFSYLATQLIAFVFSKCIDPVSFKAVLGLFSDRMQWNMNEGRGFDNGFCCMERGVLTNVGILVLWRARVCYIYIWLCFWSAGGSSCLWTYSPVIPQSQCLTMGALIQGVLTFFIISYLFGMTPTRWCWLSPSTIWTS